MVHICLLKLLPLSCLAKVLCVPVATSVSQTHTLTAFEAGNSSAIEEGQAGAGKWGISVLRVVYTEAGAPVENLWPAAMQEDKLFCNISCSDTMDVQMLLHIFEDRNNI